MSRTVRPRNFEKFLSRKPAWIWHTSWNLSQALLSFLASPNMQWCKLERALLNNRIQDVEYGFGGDIFFFSSIHKLWSIVHWWPQSRPFQIFTIQVLLFHLCQATEYQIKVWCVRMALLKAVLLFFIIQCRREGRALCSLVCSREAPFPLEMPVWQTVSLFRCSFSGGDNFWLPQKYPMPQYSNECSVYSLNK